MPKPRQPSAAEAQAAQKAEVSIYRFADGSTFDTLFAALVGICIVLVYAESITHVVARFRRFL
jgi:hypothetical protein